MSGLIDRQALCEYALNQKDKSITPNEIMRFPSAEPVRHGKNIGTDYDETDQFVCSECGIELQGWYRVERDEDDGEETYHEYRLRYCPQCGARMDANEYDAYQDEMSGTEAQAMIEGYENPSH